MTNEDSFKKILAAKEKRTRSKGKKLKPLDLGETRSGQPMTKGPFREDEERKGPEHSGSWKLRTYRKVGASQGRGKLGGIRK